MISRVDNAAIAAAGTGTGIVTGTHTGSAQSTPETATSFRPLRSLYGKLSLALLVLFLALGTFLIWVASFAADQYYQEITQRLNASVAMYVADEQPLIQSGYVNTEALKELANRAMIINPVVEIYLLDADGNVLSHGLPEGSVRVDAIDLGPIRQFMASDSNFPLRSTDPRNPGQQKIFSAAPVMDRGELQGYVYVILGGEKYDLLSAQANRSYVLKLAVAGIASVLTFALLTAMLIISRMTRRLQRLQNQVVAYQKIHMDSVGNSEGDEIEQLVDAFRDMRRRIDDQFRQIQQADQTRRDLVSNVSHDLRTPLTSMQGYIETLIIRFDRLDEKQKKAYLATARKHCLRLNRLVSELFELSKLDSHSIRPHFEEFSLAELLQDTAQEFQLKCEQKRIDLKIQLPRGDTRVLADIGLIQRVLENLVANAVRHTPQGGTVRLSMRAQGKAFQLQISDNGSGIKSHEIPHIFDRLYQAENTVRGSQDTLGLGLAIVKRILDLHQSHISVKSALNSGTMFSFNLNRVTAM